MKAHILITLVDNGYSSFYVWFRILFSNQDISKCCFKSYSSFSIWCPICKGFGDKTTNMGHYETLQISQSATQEEIKKQFRMLSLQNHPDKGGDPQKYQEMVSAYQVLGDPEKRQIYDTYGDIGIPLQYIRGIKYVLFGVILILILLIIQLLLWDQGSWFLIFIPTFIIYSIILIIILDSIFHPPTPGELDEMEEISPKDVRLMSGLLLSIFSVFVTTHILLLLKLEIFHSWRLELIMIPFWLLESFIFLRNMVSFFVPPSLPENAKIEFLFKLVNIIVNLCTISFAVLLCIRQYFIFQWALVFLPLFVMPFVRCVVPIYWCRLDRANIGSQVPVFIWNGFLELQVVLFCLSTNGIIQTREAFIPILIMLFLLLLLVTITGIGFILSLKKEKEIVQPITDPGRMITSK
eukprot:NODE_342_length_10579_cov_0.629389.p2 type:complete len:408 gc:universal NODE_342_length_10579_cov_0.629389:7884-9107(+)